MSDKREFTEHNINEDNVSVYAYDKAVVEDFRARFVNKDTNKPIINETVMMSSTNKMFNIIGELNKDTVVMPFIGLQRLNWHLNLDRQGYQTFIGEQTVIRLDSENKPIEVRAQVIPITINYQLSVYSTDLVTNDALCRELLFYYHLRPSLMVYVAHGLNMAHKFNIYFNSEIEDNSDIQNFDINGTYYRQDLTFYTDDAYLWYSDYEPLVEICPNINFNFGVENQHNENVIDRYRQYLS